MNLKKWLLTSACISAMMFAACSSSDDSNPAEPDPIAVSSDSSVEPASADNGTTSANSNPSEAKSSDGKPAVASSSSAPVPQSSEKGTAEVMSSTTDKFTYVAVTEIMYNAPDNSELEWIELTIQSGEALSDMSIYQMRIEGAVTYSFPREPLDIGEYIVVTNDPDLFKQTYPDFTGRLFGPWDDDPKTGTVAKLVNEGDVVEVKITGKGDVTAAYGSEPPWPSLANGKGHSLVFKGGNSAQPSAWAASKVIGGTPGVGPDAYITKSFVRLNELKPFVLDETPGWIELYNAGADPVDVKGWEFESKLKKKKWNIQGENTVVPAMGFLVLEATEANFGEDLYLSDQGGEFYLYETIDGEHTGAESSLMLAASQKSSGVVDISDGSLAQGALIEETPGAPNSPLHVGNLVINEIHYHPVEADPRDFEFMEIVNRGAEGIKLFAADIGGMTKGWKIEGVNFEFTTGDSIPPGGMIILLSDSLRDQAADFRSRNAISDDVQFMYYKGRLSNRGETVAIKRPTGHGEKHSDGTVQWYFEWSDAALYLDNWAGEDFRKTDGLGFSLQRKDFTTMGYEASAWMAAEPTPGK